MKRTAEARDEAKQGTGEAPPAAPLPENHAMHEKHRKNMKYTKAGNAGLTPLTGHEAAFKELGDMDALYRGTTAHVRQHVNPLTSVNQRLLDPPEGGWGAVFADPTLPLQVDIGCGSGRFVLIRAVRLKGAANVLGVEIRGALVDRALVWRDRLKEQGKLDNAHFMSGNATISLVHLLSSYPGRVELISVQYPDPHFKKRHLKRRVVQPHTVKHLAEVMKPRPGDDATRPPRFVVQGDVPEPLRYIRNMVERHGDGAFVLSPENRGQAAPAGWADMAGSADEKLAADAVDGVIADAGGGADEEDGQDEAAAVAGSAGCGAARGSDGLLRSEWAGEPAETEAYAAAWAHDPNAGWLDPATNPLGVPTEREVYVLKANVEVYRLVMDRVVA